MGKDLTAIMAVTIEILGALLFLASLSYSRPQSQSLDELHHGSEEDHYTHTHGHDNAGHDHSSHEDEDGHHTDTDEHVDEEHDHSSHEDGDDHYPGDGHTDDHPGHSHHDGHYPGDGHENDH